MQTYRKELTTPIYKEFLEIKKSSTLLGKKSKRYECTKEMNLELWKRSPTSLRVRKAHLKLHQNTISHLSRPTNIQNFGSILYCWL